ncbi:unnamed protein product [Brugia timori]|uniref:Uncharacterized protein n=1 Tax=Brugia timori TaxID=42155 RepID=A0A3P7VX57_9BILA|nr:unnamed protein product [Brugia timori]
MEHLDEFIAIKNWTNDSWTCHISILAETGIGAELELHAFRSDILSSQVSEPKENVRLSVQDVMIIDIRKYDENKIFLSKVIFNRSIDISDTSFMQEYFQPKDSISEKKFMGIYHITIAISLYFLSPDILIYDEKVHDDSDEGLFDTALMKITRGCHIDLYLLSVIWEKKQTVATMYVMLGVMHQNVGYSVMTTKSNLLVKKILNRDGTGYIYFYLNR